jgi:hypothetical protein
VFLTVLTFRALYFSLAMTEIKSPEGKIGRLADGLGAVNFKNLKFAVNLEGSSVDSEPHYYS